MKALARSLVGVSVAALFNCLAAAQCALCRNAFLYSVEGQAMAEGFNRGILFLLAVPFLTALTLVLAIRSARRPRS